MKTWGHLPQFFFSESRALYYVVHLPWCVLCDLLISCMVKGTGKGWNTKILISEFIYHHFFLSAKAKITEGPKDVIVFEGNSTKFSCVAQGDPQPTVFWQMKRPDSRPMFPNENYQGRFFVAKSGELEIIDIRKDDEGIYVCFAVSLNGITEAKAQLTVIGRFDMLLLCASLLKLVATIQGCALRKIEWEPSALNL